MAESAHLVMPDGVALPRDVVEVWWAYRPGLSTADRQGLEALLDPLERARHSAYRQQNDRDRFALGAGIVRLACARYLGTTAESIALDRLCRQCSRPHGKVRLAASMGVAGPRFSVSHGGDWVGVAFARDADVGLDVEQIRKLDVAALARGVLTSNETKRPDGTLISVADFVRTWTRKEAVVKATADGLMVPLSRLEVTAADRAPAVTSWADRSSLVGRIQLHDLADRSDHLASLAILSDREFRVSEFSMSGISTSE